MPCAGTGECPAGKTQGKLADTRFTSGHDAVSIYCGGHVKPEIALIQYPDGTTEPLKAFIMGLTALMCKIRQGIGRRKV